MYDMTKVKGANNEPKLITVHFASCWLNFLLILYNNHSHMFNYDNRFLMNVM